jgi:hypothetical protein
VPRRRQACGIPTMPSPVRTTSDPRFPEDPERFRNVRSGHCVEAALSAHWVPLAVSCPASSAAAIVTSPSPGRLRRPTRAGGFRRGSVSSRGSSKRPTEHRRLPPPERGNSSRVRRTRATVPGYRERIRTCRRRRAPLATSGANPPLPPGPSSAKPGPSPRAAGQGIPRINERHSLFVAAAHSAAKGS